MLFAHGVLYTLDSAADEVQYARVPRQGGISAEEEKLVSESTIGQWADFWNTRGELPPGFGALQALPEPMQKRVAAGFELLARKPLATGQTNR